MIYLCMSKYEPWGEGVTIRLLRPWLKKSTSSTFPSRAIAYARVPGIAKYHHTLFRVRWQLKQVYARLYSYPISCTPTVLLLGPSRSIMRTLCHSPMTISPSTTGMHSELPSIIDIR